MSATAVQSPGSKVQGVEAGPGWYRDRAIHWAREARRCPLSQRTAFRQLAKHYLARLKFLFPAPQP